MTKQIPPHLEYILEMATFGMAGGSEAAKQHNITKLRAILAAALAESQRPLMTEIGEEELSFCCGQEAGVECWEICTRRQLKEALADATNR